MTVLRRSLQDIVAFVWTCDIFLLANTTATATARDTTAPPEMDRASVVKDMYDRADVNTNRTANENCASACRKDSSCPAMW